MLVLAPASQAAQEAKPERKAPIATAISLEDAVQQVQQKTDGRILSADEVRGSRTDKYRIKVLMNDGRVQVLEVDSKPDKIAESDTDKARSKEKD